MSERPFMTVVIPTCDRPAQLEGCLERLSPGRQSFPHEQFEVIVTDDGRHASARGLVADRFPWATWIVGPHRGPAANRNNGARHARGEWLIFTDDDCVPEPDWLESYASEMIAGRAALEGRVRSEPTPTSAWDEAPINERGGLFWSANIAVRRDLFECVGGFDENYESAAMEDVDLRETLKSRGFAITFVSSATVFHPMRRADLAMRWAHARKLRSAVYFDRKWLGPHPVRNYLHLMRGMLHHWLLVPVRLGWSGMRLAALYPAAACYATWNFPHWYRQADRQLQAMARQ